MELTADTPTVVRVPGWERFPWLKHGFSTRHGGTSTVYGSPSLRGDLNLGFTKDDAADAVRANRALVTEAVAGKPGWTMVSVRQIHGDFIKVVSAGETDLATPYGRATVDADGLITATPNILLSIQVADCVPVLVADTRLRIVAAFHAGWRGTVAGIVQKGIARMQAEFGSSPAHMIGAVGPSIASCCYTVGEEVHQAFESTFPYAAELFSQRAESLHLDLAKANRLQLRDAGLREESITVIGECTGCGQLDGRRKYFSHRLEAGFTGRAMGLIGVTEAAAL